MRGILTGASGGRSCTNAPGRSPDDRTPGRGRPHPRSAHPAALPRHSAGCAGTRMSRLPFVAMADTTPDFSICSSRRAARL